MNATRAVFLRNALLACAVIFSGPAAAQLKPGQAAPGFTLEATLAGEAFPFSLDDALKKGPVVLYFYPAAFTKGCTIEAHNFAEAMSDYQQAGATVLGISADDLEKLKEFSVSACRGKFAVASDVDAKVIKAYGAQSAFMPDKASRISYVITPDHKVYYSYQSGSPDEHVPRTLAAVRQWAAAKQ
ncbi:peroxiredoxin [Pusillimonas sp. ANT_WB101]|uniref:peroxiredoxin n=1 Tax=Pusillimonas sp. ANT_WB101 TaxID=2597356 RepID=UPI0011EEF45B|nr:peroxiredoxin [Pusillimonas sp. ANT_WB101]KAA0911972.1 peroxiredoxin [Pusillimonas sp. ANT_WB101]